MIFIDNLYQTKNEWPVTQKQIKIDNVMRINLMIITKTSW